MIKTLMLWSGLVMICAGAMSGYHYLAGAGFVLFVAAAGFMKGK